MTSREKSQLKTKIKRYHERSAYYLMWAIEFERRLKESESE